MKFPFSVCYFYLISIFFFHFLMLKTRFKLEKYFNNYLDKNAFLDNLVEMNSIKICIFVLQSIGFYMVLNNLIPNC